MSQPGWTFNPNNPICQVRENAEKEIRNGRFTIAFLWS